MIHVTGVIMLDDKLSLVLPSSFAFIEVACNRQFAGNPNWCIR